MDRRAFFFVATGTAASVGIAGCLGAPGSDPQPGNTPAAAVEYFSALAEGDREVPAAILTRIATNWNDSPGKQTANLGHTISNGTIVDQQNPIRLRTEDGEWRIWNED